MCVISDCLKHDTITVHRFLQDVLPHLKDRCPQIKKVHYFSDGAASQYKNTKTFLIFCAMKVILSCKQSGISLPPVMARMLVMGSEEQ